MSAISTFCDWLQRTPLSVALQENGWVVPAVQTVHILCVALVMFSSLLLSLRLLGLSARDLSPSGVVQRFVPVIWRTLPVLLVTGGILIVAEPARALQNPAFYLTMGLLLGASVLTVVYQRLLRENGEPWNATQLRAVATKLIAVLSVSMWSGVVLAGRWIAYIDSL
jgi:polyferredoxin